MQPPFPELPQSADSSSSLLDVRAQPSMRPPMRPSKFESPFHVLWRRKWLALFVAAVLLTTIATYVSTLQNIYKAETTVLVERPQFDEGIEGDTRRRLTVLTQQILSYDRLAELIERFQLYPEMRGLVPLEDIVSRMQAEIQLQQQESTQRRGKRSVTAFSLSYQGKDPVKIADVTNTLTTFYKKGNVKSRTQKAGERTQVLQDRLERTRQQLEAQEQAISVFKEEHIGELPEQLSANLATLERLNDQLRLNSSKLTQAKERRANLLQQKTDSTHIVREAPVALDKTELERQELHQRLSDLLGSYTKKHPDVIRVMSQIAALERRQTGQTVAPEDEAKPLSSPPPQGEGLKQQLNETKTEIKVLTAEERNLRLSINHYQARVEIAPRIERRLQRLIRAYDVTEERYLNFQKDYEKAKMVRVIEQREQGERFDVLVPAIPPKAPIAPKRRQYYLAGLAMSLALGVGIVFLRDKMDSSFHVVEDLRAFSPVPILVSLPRIETPADLRRQRRRFCVNMAAALVFLYVLSVSTYTFATGDLPLHVQTWQQSLQTFIGQTFIGRTFIGQTFFGS